jgi:hypothetical protein
MERYELVEWEDFLVMELIDRWEVSAYRIHSNDREIIEVYYWDLVHFTKDYLELTGKKAIDHLIKCGEEETEKLLKGYFLKKYSNEK